MESFSVPRNENAAETICTTIVISRLRTVMITAKAITVSMASSILLGRSLSV